MSSPFSTLGKLRKVSLALPEVQHNGRRSVSFKGSLYTEDEAALLSEILPCGLVSPASSSVCLTPTQKPKAKDTGPNDVELMSTMMSRLTELEQRVRAQAREISSKNKEVAVLEEKVKTLQKTKVDEPKRKHELEKYLQLQNQVWEMEKFLNDYGMAWVGDQSNENSNEDMAEEEEEIIVNDGDRQTDSSVLDLGTQKTVENGDQPKQVAVAAKSGSLPSSPGRSNENEANDYESEMRKLLTALQETSGFPFLEEPFVQGVQQLEGGINSTIQQVSATLDVLNTTLQQVDHKDDGVDKPFQVEFDLILENIKELNILAGEGEAKVQHVTGGAVLKRPDPIPLTFFRNGIVMFNGPFRSFEEPSTQHCILDLADGYFPSELENKFPEGIPFQVSDRRDVIFQERRLFTGFPGVGQTVHGSRVSGVPLEEYPEGVQVTSQLPGKKLSVEQFLRMLPRNVIKGGKVIDIRGEIGNSLLSQSQRSNSVILIETPSLISMKERLKVKEKNRSSLDTITTLRIKSENGEQTYIAKMLFSETVKELRRYLDESRPQQSIDYDIVSTFPQQVYSDPDKTLEEYGLIPNAALMLQASRR